MKTMNALLLFAFATSAYALDAPRPSIFLNRAESRDIYGRLGFGPSRPSVKNLVCVCHDCAPDSEAEGDALRMESEGCRSDLGSGKVLVVSAATGVILDRILGREVSGPFWQVQGAAGSRNMSYRIPEIRCANSAACVIYL